MNQPVRFRCLATLHRISVAHSRIGLSTVIGLGLVALSVVEGPTLAQSPTSSEIETASSPEQETRNTSDLDSPDRTVEEQPSPSPQQIVQLGLLPFIPPPEEPAPQNTLGGGRRNNQCIDSIQNPTDTTNSLQIAVLAPPAQIIGLTERDKPTVWLHQPLPSVRQILLSVREEDSQEFHSQTTIDVLPDRQWVPLQLADNAPVLEPGKTYLWAAIALCGEAPNPNDPAISIRVRRIDSPPSDTTSTTPLSLAERYARQGQWYDAVDAFVQAQSSANVQLTDEAPNIEGSSDEQLSETWQALLDYAELDEIAPPLPIPTGQ